MSSVYLDIETTSLEPQDGELTVVGFYLEEEGELVQLHGTDLHPGKLYSYFTRRHTLYTYNGERFDLPFIHAKLKVDLARLCHHVDLMHECHAQALRGGMKKVEKMLGIPRRLAEVNGCVAVELWRHYRDHNDMDALRTLLEYNAEDVMNLQAMRRKLRTRSGREPRDTPFPPPQG